MLDDNANIKRQERTALEYLLALSVVAIGSVICSSVRVFLYA